jgi:hypothetical protein
MQRQNMNNNQRIFFTLKLKASTKKTNLIDNKGLQKRTNYKNRNKDLTNMLVHLA